jgi:hypothetical protein
MSRKPASRRARATPDQSLDRHARVQLEAYLIAERRGFAPGNEIDDWLEAERQVDAVSPE